jgi:hypothetical protein
MNRKEATELLPIIKAFSEGRPIQYRIKDNESAIWNNVDRNYHNFSPHSFLYRIKPEQKYRTFKDTEECWTEMLKHQPFGWVKDKKDVHHRVLITAVDDDTCGMSLNGNAEWSLSGIMDLFTFADGTPFGVKVEE